MGSRMVSSIMTWLKTRYIAVPEDWVTACLEWISSENQDTKDEVVVRGLVYEQWLLTDLRDFGSPSLPPGVKDENFTLTGNYCVQIDNVTDVSLPKYSQLLQRQNKESGNTFISAETQPTQKPWEAKPTRMLMMKITDGFAELSAMEYMPIATLSDKLPPGTKIKIKGSIKCRRGVLMLKQSNVEVLGGEVEDLFAENNYVSVLCQGLGRPVPSNPVQVNNQVTEIPSSNENVRASNTGVADEDLRDILADAEFDDFDCDNLPNFEKNVTSVAPTTSKHESSDVILISDDEALADILDDADNDDDELIASADLPVFSEPLVSSPVRTERLDSEPKKIDRFQPYSAPKTSNLGRNAKIEFGAATAVTRDQPVATRNQALETNNKQTRIHNSALLRSEKCLKSSSFAQRSEFSTQRPGSSGSIVANQSKQQSVTLTSDNVVVSEKDVRSYLCHAKKALLTNLTDKKLNVRIKAIVITLLSKLNSDIISGWSLKARICDGTAMLDVEFGNNVLQKLIGFSAADKDAIKQTQDSSEKQKLISGLNKCRETIISMCHFMGVEVRRLDDDQVMGFVTDIEL